MVGMRTPHSYHEELRSSIHWVCCCNPVNPILKKPGSSLHIMTHFHPISIFPFLSSILEHFAASLIKAHNTSGQSGQNMSVSTSKQSCRPPPANVFSLCMNLPSAFFRLSSSLTNSWSITPLPKLFLWHKVCPQGSVLGPLLFKSDQLHPVSLPTLWSYFRSCQSHCLRQSWSPPITVCLIHLLSDLTTTTVLNKLSPLYSPPLLLLSNHLCLSPSPWHCFLKLVLLFITSAQSPDVPSTYLLHSSGNNLLGFKRIQVCCCYYWSDHLYLPYSFLY